MTDFELDDEDWHQIGNTSGVFGYYQEHHMIEGRLNHTFRSIGREFAWEYRCGYCHAKLVPWAAIISSQLHVFPPCKPECELVRFLEGAGRRSIYASDS